MIVVCWLGFKIYDNVYEMTWQEYEQRDYDEMILMLASYLSFPSCKLCVSHTIIPLVEIREAVSFLHIHSASTNLEPHSKLAVDCLTTSLPQKRQFSPRTPNLSPA